MDRPEQTSAAEAAEPSRTEARALRKAAIDAATPESETERVASLAETHKIELPTDLPLDQTPALIQPAARLFAATVAELGPNGGQLLAILQDSRYDALSSAIAEVVERLIALAAPNAEAGARLALARATFDKDRVELAAVRAVEDFALPMLVQLRDAIAEHEAAQRRAALTRIGTPEERDAVAQVLNGGATVKDKRGRRGR